MEILQQLLAVALVLGALGALVWLLKRKGLAGGGVRVKRDVQTQLEVVGRLALTPQHSVHLIRLADRVLLVGLSPGGCSVLDTAPAAGILPPETNH